VVIDGHCKIGHDRYFNNLVDCFQRSGADCLARPQPFILPEEPNWQRAIGLARSSWLGHSTKSDIYSDKEAFVSPMSAGCAYKREVFEKVGYVYESFDACEDVEFNYRVEKAGFKTFFSPKIAVHYYPRESVAALWWQLVRYGKGRFKLLAKHPDSIQLNTLIPSFFLLSVLFGAIVSLFSQIVAYSFIIGVLIYLLIICMEAVRLRRNDAYIHHFLVAFIIIHFGFGYGFLIKSITSFRI